MPERMCGKGLQIAAFYFLFSEKAILNFHSIDMVD